MVKKVTQYNLLISCPSDIKEEIQIIKEIIDSFNCMYGLANGLYISIKHWSTDPYPQLGGSPQMLLNNQFIYNCDAAVVVFWTRFGTPTNGYESGTEEEIENLIKAGKQVFLYFSDCKVNPSSLDHEQYQKVLAFRNKYECRGVYWKYSNIDDFKKILSNHISLYFAKIKNNGNDENSNNSYN